MKLNRNYKYRIYLTPEQEKITRGWMATLRFLWNICHEQRLLGLLRSKNSGRFIEGKDNSDERIFLTNFSQNKQMTELMVEHPWIAEVQCDARQMILADLDKAWKACFKKIGGKPRFKSRRDFPHIYTNNKFVCVGDRRIGKLSFDSPRYRAFGTIKIVLDRPLPEKVSAWDIIKDQNEWYAVARCTIENDDPKSVNDKVVGIDRGVALLLADSDGRKVENPHFLNQLRNRITRAQREVSRRARGSANQRKAKAKVAKLQRLVARRREVFINTESLYYAKNYGTVVIEKLRIENMTKSAKGTVENPGKNVAAKSGLNKAILDSGWGAFGQQLKYKTEERGAKLLEVNPSYTSQTCPKCDHIAAENRLTQSEFKCVKCGFEGNADVIAAIEIRSRGIKNEVVEKKPRTKISRQGRKAKPKKLDEKNSLSSKTTVKPTVVQPVEDKLTASNAQAFDAKSPVETGTDIRENIHHTYGLDLVALDTTIP